MPNQRGNHPGFQFHPVGVGGTDDVSWLIQPERDRLAGTRRSTLTPEQVEMTPKHGAVAILPSSDLNASQAFYQRLGFVPTSTYESHGYRILHDSLGASIHLTRVDPGSVDPQRNAHGVYLYSADVEALAASFGSRALSRPWGVREFAVSDPDGTLVRVGWPS